MDSEAETAFRDMVERRGDALARTAYLLTGDWAKAEDLVQSALATTWALRLHKDSEAGPVGWTIPFSMN